ncbi:hypothetical protein G6F46_010922 [Rhizopus delemar]|uniref:Coth-domain-containing protein n=3 Tax=Rhizopus TaxID=4842 RepID=I1C347_RHIO9|nr:hypothetical protein RO3G_07582 [Rhizopus delemar RA 99-880]KAG1449522.1 hypothetical protein G6F55_010132 [Rhizopus delemar]KAG1536426.1 hypothetical protein G6F51_010977 [Rhizopus arrhizus]KAG1490908.1 hypothetical protein G6F54_010390 [Rhizopus delemar]KAG1507531.1 hypothetical protein G6F53_008881 [Rhizopus delemar]|eukprot:EIE82877.1 hypothetical protein RO3G_07582 [Rhizopus delemar RA 99-880]
MLISWLSTLLVLVIAFVNVEGKPSVETITYSVVALLNNSQLMGVEVDSAIHILQLDQPSTILYRGKAPVARQSYRYVKINAENYCVTAEGFYRPPETIDTVNEYFNRTWNKKKITPFPQVYEPLSIIKRIPTKLHKEGEISTIHLVADQQELDKMHQNYGEDIDVKATMSYVSITDSLFFKHIKMSISGHSSRWMPKVPYNIKIEEGDRLYGFQRIKVRSLGNDPSYLREKLAYDMIKALGLPDTELSYCRLFLNGQELGLFGVIEMFQDPWSTLEFGNGDKDYEGGIVYQAHGHAASGRYSDLEYLKNLSDYKDGQYDIKSDGKQSFKPLQKFTKFIAEGPVEGKHVVDIWNTMLHMETFLRSMVLEVLNSYWDGLIAHNHNFYLYNSPDTDNFIYISADLDFTFGSVIIDSKPMLTGNYNTFPGMHTQNLMSKVLQVREFREQFEEMLFHVAKHLVNPEVTNGRIDDLVDMIQEDVIWDQNLPRLGVLVQNLAKKFNIPLKNGKIPADLDVKSMIRQALTTNTEELGEFAHMIPKGDPENIERTLIYIEAILKGVPFFESIYSSTGYEVFMGLKEYIRTISRNTLDYFYSIGY